MVLSALHQAPETDPLYRCGPLYHVGITPVVFTHEYELAELDTSQLTILKFRANMRVGPYIYAPLPEATDIGIYTAKSPKGIRVLGRVDAKAVYSKRLTRRIGDGTGSTFPLCGPLRSEIGRNAVFAWRKEHDREALEKELAMAPDFEVLEAERLAKQREAARSRRKSK